jgi:hypothetical protein
VLSKGEAERLLAGMSGTLQHSPHLRSSLVP